LAVGTQAHAAAPAGAGSGGVANIVITATNAFGSSTQALALTVNESPVFTNNITTTFTLGSPGTFQFTANAYPAPTFAAVGTLPAGVTLSSNGILSGTPSGTSGTYQFVMTVGNGIGSNKVQTFSLMVNEAPVFFTDASTVFVGGQSGSFPVTANGFPHIISYALASGSNPLPAIDENQWVKVAGTMNFPMEEGLLQPILTVDRTVEAEPPFEESFLRNQ
jgi:hypothetical protein